MNTEIERRWEKDFDQKFLVRENGKKVIKTGLNTIWGEEIKSFIRSLLSQEREKFEKELKQGIGMLRQALNEDRITDPNKIVTNEYIETWLSALKKKE